MPSLAPVLFAIAKRYLVWALAPAVARKIYEYYMDRHPEHVVGFAQQLYARYPELFTLNALPTAANTAVANGLEYIETDRLEEVSSAFEYEIVTTNRGDLFEVDLFYDGETIFKKKITKTELRTALHRMRRVR